MKRWTPRCLQEGRRKRIFVCRRRAVLNSDGFHAEPASVSVSKTCLVQLNNLLDGS